MYKKIGFIGGGRITHLLLKRLMDQNVLPEQVLVCDPDTTMLAKLQDLSIPGLKIKTENDLEDSPELIFIAVHPPVAKTVIPDLQKDLDTRTILISLVPVIKMSAIQQLSGGHQRIVRMIPNAPSVIGKGYNPVSFSGTISTSEKSDLMTLFDHWGETPEVPEDHLEAYAILSAMGPTYFWFQWMELQGLGLDYGLSRDDIKTSLHKMLVGSSELLFNSAYLPEEVMDMIPVKPLNEDEYNIRNIINSKLTGLYAKLTANK